MCRRLSRHRTKNDCVGVRHYILFGGGGGVPGSNLDGGPVTRTGLSVFSSVLPDKVHCNV
jgi:hypothetical protein